MEIVCSICSKIISCDDRVVAVRCGHVFHSQCLLIRLSSTDSCFKCNQKVRMIDAIPLQLDVKQPETSPLRQELKIPHFEISCMLLVLQNPEQTIHKITFALPNETCTLKDILDSVNIHISGDAAIECIERVDSAVRFIVKIGKFGPQDENNIKRIAEATEKAERLRRNHEKPIHLRREVRERRIVQQPRTVDRFKDQIRVIKGFYIICPTCKCSGVNLDKCERCHRPFKKVACCKNFNKTL